MLRYWQNLSLAWILILSVQDKSTIAFAQSSSSYNLKDVESYYLDKKRSSPSFMRSIPITHISPARNKVTVAVEGGITDTTVKGVDNNFSNSFEPEKLELGGYSFAPYFSLSLKNLGLGIAGETSVKTLKYTPDRYGSNSVYLEESKLDYSGIGIYLFLNPAPKSRRMRWNLVLGSRMVNVKHQARSYYEGSSNSGAKDWSELKYTVQSTTAGTNVRIPLGRKLALVPWADYKIVNTSQLDSTLTDSIYQPNANRFAADREIFWKAENAMQYGIDVAIKFGRFDFHIGDILGPILSNEADDPRFDDSGDFSVSFSYDFKDR